MRQSKEALQQRQTAARNKKNLILLLAAAFFALVNFYTALTILPLYVTEIGGTEFDVGVQTTLFYLAAIILRFYFGPLTDSKGRKIPLAVGAFAFATAPLLFMISSSVWALTLARIYQAIGLASFFSAGSSLAADLAPRQKVGLYIGAYRLMFTLALLSGPYSALFVIDAYNYSVWFTISFLIGVLALGLVLLLTPPQFSAGEKLNIINHFGVIIKERAVRPIFLGIALISVGYGALLTFAVLYISEVSSVANPGVYFTYFSLTGIVSNLSSGYLSDRFGRPLIVWPAIMLMGLGVALLYHLPGTPVIFAVSSFLGGMGFAGGLAALIAWLVDTTDEKIRGTVLALQESTIDFAIGAGSFVFGITTVRIGMSGSFLGMGLVVLLPAALLLFRNKTKNK